MLIEAGGQIMLGTLKPVTGAAIAQDGHKTVAMLRRQPGETIDALLLRLDTAQSASVCIQQMQRWTHLAQRA